MKKHGKFRRTFLMVCTIIIAFVGIGFWFSRNKNENDVKKYEQKNETLQNESELTKKKLSEECIKANRLRESISNEIQIVILTEKGNIEIFHDKTPKNNKYTEWLVNSDVKLTVYYTAIFTIPSDFITVEYNKKEDKVEICYDEKKIDVTSINVDNITSESRKSLFGTEYKPGEITALTMIAKDSVKEEIINDNGLNFLAKINLERYLRNLAYSIGIIDVSIKEI